MVYTIIFVVLMVIYLGLMMVSRRHYNAFLEEYRGIGFPLLKLLPPMMFVIDRVHLFRLIPRMVNTVHRDMIGLFGLKKAHATTKMFIAQILTIQWFILQISLFIPMVNDDDAIILVWGCLIIILLPFVFIKDLAAKMRKRQQAIILELPLLLNKIMLLVNAGETIKQAIIRCVEQQPQPEQHPLYAEFISLIHQLEMNYPFDQAMEEFSRRCSVQEVSLFTNTVLLHYRRGGSEFVAALRTLSQQLWEKRKTVAKVLGEEASSKLVFPLVMIFLIVMVIVAAPAIMLMSS